MHERGRVVERRTFGCCLDVSKAGDMKPQKIETEKFFTCDKIGWAKALATICLWWVQSDKNKNYENPRSRREMLHPCYLHPSTGPPLFSNRFFLFFLFSNCLDVFCVSSLRIALSKIVDFQVTRKKRKASTFVFKKI